MGYSGNSDVLQRSGGAPPDFGAGDPPPPKTTGDGSDRRKFPREKVLKSAKIIVNHGQTVFDCLVLDESPAGVYIDLGALVALPPEVTIQYGSGATFLAERRWNAGTRFGFEFHGPQVISRETAKRLEVIGQILNSQGLPAAVELLRLAQFFDNPQLRRIAEEASTAHARLQGALHGQEIAF
jgi:hypothetical protein